MLKTIRARYAPFFASALRLAWTFHFLAPQARPAPFLAYCRPMAPSRPEAKHRPSTPWRAMTPPPRPPASWVANYEPVGGPEMKPVLALCVIKALLLITGNYEKVMPPPLRWRALPPCMQASPAFGLI